MTEMQDLELNQPNQINPKNMKSRSTFKLTMTFIGIYLLFNLTFTTFGSGLLSLELYKLSLFRDSTLIISIFLYAVIISLIFLFFGVKFYKIASQHLFKRIIIILPITVLGLLIWFMSFLQAIEYNISFGGLSWLGYLLFVYWSMPVFEVLRVYFDNSNMLMYIGLIPTILPGLSFLLGIWVAEHFNWQKNKLKIVLLTLQIPLLLIIILTITAKLPSSTEFTLDTYPEIDGATVAIPFGEELMQELTGASVQKAKSEVSFHKSHQAYVNLIEKRADIIFVSGPSDDELKLAKEKNVKLNLTPIAKGNGKEKNIVSGNDPYNATLYAVTRDDEQNENSTKLLNWILSAEGSQAIEKGGFVPIN
jgi:phosphate transport system substrate-binding protein